jgi:sensitive to high expression protein 9, mitochondrial
MQPIARPGARLIHDQLRFISRVSSGPGSRLSLPPPRLPSSGLSICLRCSIRAIEAPRRLYSTQQPLSSKRPYQSSNFSSTSPTTSPVKTESSPHELPSTTDDRRSRLSKRFTTVMDNLQSSVLSAFQTLNSITGYTGIEEIKHKNTTLERSLSEAKSSVRAARALYKTTNSKRSATQREVTALLARKDGWSPADLERFTELYRADHTLEGEVASASEQLTEAEAEEQKLSAELNAGILKRYHEEQIWSDRIRQASTWGTWGLMGVNVLLFLVLQFVAEPWKRKRLVKGVVEEERGVLEEVRGGLEEVRRVLVEGKREEEQRIKEEMLVATALAKMPVEAPNWSWADVFRDPPRLGAAVGDLYSERRIDLRMRDISLVALEGAAAGATVVGAAMYLILRRN